jgi:hypothetical protein
VRKGHAQKKTHEERYFCLMVKHRIMDMSYTQDVYMSHGTEYVFSINGD